MPFDINNPYIVALINALLIPLLIFTAGFLMETLSNTLIHILSRLIGTKASFAIRNYITFPGTMHHELSHALFAFLSGAKVTKVVLFHIKGEQLGCVEFIPRGNAFSRAVQMTLSSIAPVVCGAISLCLLSWVWQYRCTLIWQYLLVGYLFISIAFHMNMSVQDIKNALRGMPVTIFICFVIFFFLPVSLL